MKMTLLWIVLAFIGSFLTVFSGIKLAQARAKDIKSEVQKIAHPIPQKLYLDATIKFKADSTFQKLLNNQILTKISVPNGSTDDMEKIPLIGFFDEVKFEQNEILKKNYEIKTDFFNGLKNMELIGNVISKQSNVYVQLNSNETNRKLTSEENLNTYSSIEIVDYERTSNLITVRLMNFALNVGRTSFSESLIDLNDGKISCFIITGPNFEFESIERIEIKTEMARYFGITDINIGEMNEISGTLKRLSI
jgi:hypothetical protein